MFFFLLVLLSAIPKSCKSCKSCKFCPSKRFWFKITVTLMFDSFMQGLVGATKKAFRLFKTKEEDLLIKQSQELLPISCKGITNN